MNYTKQPLDYSQIIQQLKSRGLLFHDEAAAENELKIVSYFRLANYLRTFEVPNSNHVFLPNSYFKARLKLLLAQHSYINLHAMGFPTNWQNEPLWK